MRFFGRSQQAVCEDSDAIQHEFVSASEAFRRALDEGEAQVPVSEAFRQALEEEKAQVPPSPGHGDIIGTSEASSVVGNPADQGITNASS